MVVKKIDGMQTMLASYWDAGYIKLDVTDPAEPEVHRRLRLRRAPTR